MTVETIPADDVAYLTSFYDTNQAFIRSLVAHGVKPGDLDQVLRIRDESDIQNYDSYGYRLQVDSVSAAILAKAYVAVNGNTEELERLADCVREAIGQLSGIGQQFGIVNLAFDRAIADYEQCRLGAYDGDLLGFWEA